MKEKIEKAKLASAEAAMEARIATAVEREKAKGKDFFKELLDQLQSSTVPKTEVDQLKAILKDSTNRNHNLAHLLQSCSNISNFIKNLL